MAIKTTKSKQGCFLEEPPTAIFLALLQVVHLVVAMTISFYAFSFLLQ